MKNLIICICLFVSCIAVADEGMYTFDNPPIEIISKKYGVNLTQNWFDFSMQASLRFNNGGSGSFVSEDGLVITNHHVGFDSIQKLSKKDSDYIKNGFIATSRDMELKCPDLEVNMLVGIKDVTNRVINAAKTAKDEAEAGKLKRTEMAEIEKEYTDKTGLRCDVVTLYGGAQYSLYEYKKFTDVRLVFSPEEQMAFFGGDPDNFTYPRYDLDISFFRIYEGNRPYHPKCFFRFDEHGVKENELIFVIGNPGTTKRLNTIAQLEFQRDISCPAKINIINSLLDALNKYAKEGKENQRQAGELIRSFANAQKAYTGMLSTLQSSKFFNIKVAQEEDFLKKTESHKKEYKELKDAFNNIRDAENEYKTFFSTTLAIWSLSTSELFSKSLDIVQMIADRKKTNGDRLKEYRDSALESLELQLYSSAPIYNGLETTLLITTINDAEKSLGKDSELLQALLGNKTVDEVVRNAVNKTKIYDVNYRKELVKKGETLSAEEWENYVKKSEDPMIQLAAAVDPVMRKNRKLYEDKVESPEAIQMQHIQSIKYKILGKNATPDATFTPRITFGIVKGYQAEGTIVPYKTNFYGLFSRNAEFDYQDPFNLPQKWKEKEKYLDLSKSLNFVSTADIVGGNSGSPVIDINHQFVGIIFDGNIDSLASTYIYTDDKARAVSVDSAGVIEALLKIYDDNVLVNELIGKKDIKSTIVE